MADVSVAGSFRIAFTTLGCKVNRVESDEIAAHLLGRGAVLGAQDVADVVVINTCTVTGEADRKARKAVRRALSLPHGPVVVVTGCLATLDEAGLAALGERVVVEGDKERVAERVVGLLGMGDGAGVSDVTPETGSDAYEPVRVGSGFRTRVAVKVEDGCDAFCTYCIVPHARGGPRSVPLARVVAGVERLVEAGVAEVVLTGINIGRYHDAGTGAGLAGVISAVAATGVQRIRLSSVEPGDLTPDLLAVLRDTGSVCAHLHVPLQSGADRVLAAMGRPYTAAEYAARISEAREALPGLAVTTDVIAGFPGETDDDARSTIETIRVLDLARLHVFRYSRREGTPAATMPGQVAPPVIAARASELRALDTQARVRHARSWLGQVAEVLVESVDPDAEGRPVATGTTREYLTITADGTRRAPGYIGLIRVCSAEADGVRGEWL